MQVAAYYTLYLGLGGEPIVHTADCTFGCIEPGRSANDVSELFDGFSNGRYKNDTDCAATNFVLMVDHSVSCGKFAAMNRHSVMDEVAGENGKMKFSRQAA